MVTMDDLARAWGSFMAYFLHNYVGNIEERLVFINAKQYKGILKHRQICKLRQPHKKKLAMILPKMNSLSSKASHTRVKQIENFKDLEASLNKSDVSVTNIEGSKVDNHDNKDLYSPISTPSMWSSELYVKELMNMKRRLEILEEKRWYEGNKLNKIVEFKSRLEEENKALKEQISSMQGKIELGQQEVDNMKQEIRQLKMT